MTNIIEDFDVYINLEHLNKSYCYFLCYKHDMCWVWSFYMPHYNKIILVDNIDTFLNDTIQKITYINYRKCSNHIEYGSYNQNYKDEFALHRFTKYTLQELHMLLL